MSFDLFLNLSVLANTVAGVNNPAPTAVATEVAAREPFKNFHFIFLVLSVPHLKKIRTILMLFQTTLVVSSYISIMQDLTQS